MQKYLIRRPGGLKQLKIVACQPPFPRANEVAVSTRAIGVNYADCIVRMGYYASAKQYVGWPITPGFEFSGSVRAVGEAVKDLQPGDAVFGVTRFDAYATEVVVPRHQLFALPAGITHEEAAGFPTIYLTAYYALHMIVHIFPGSTVLVHSAAGGVGSALLQLCKQAGWFTIGVVGACHKVESARTMGADVVIDKNREDLWAAVERQAPHGLDVVLDGNGVATLKAGLQHLKPTGKMISYGYHTMFAHHSGLFNHLKLIWSYMRTPRINLLNMHTQNRSIATFNLSFLFDRSDLLEQAMQHLYPWFAEKIIRTPSITIYPFENAAAAHRDLQSGRTVGKLILQVRN